MLLKLRAWHRAKAPAMMENSLGKQASPSRAVSLALAMRQVVLATVELESHLMLPPYLAR